MIELPSSASNKYNMAMSVTSSLRLQLILFVFDSA